MSKLGGPASLGRGLNDFLAQAGKPPGTTESGLCDRSGRCVGLRTNCSNHGSFGLRVEAGSLPEELDRSEEHTSELQSPCNLVCRLLLEKKKKKKNRQTPD